LIVIFVFHTVATPLLFFTVEMTAAATNALGNNAAAEHCPYMSVHSAAALAPFLPFDCYS